MQLRPVSEQEVSDLIAGERQVTQWPWTSALLEQSIQSGHLCRTACIDLEKVGYCVLFDNTGAMEILNLVVFAEYQRCGYGRKILEAVRLETISRGLSEIWLEVREDNLPAIALYRSYGFIEQGCRAGYYGNSGVPGKPGKGVDAVLMSRRVDPGD